MDNVTEKKKMDGNIIGRFVSILIFLAVEIAILFYSNSRARFLGSGIEIFAVLCVIGVIYFFIHFGMIYSFIYLRNMTLVKHLIVSLVFTAILLCCFRVAYKFDIYVLHHDFSDDQGKLEADARMLSLGLKDWDYENADVSAKQTYDALCKGVMITNWDKPKDELQELILEQLHEGSFEAYRYRYKLVSGQAEVYMKIVDDTVYLRLINPTPDVCLHPMIDSYYMNSTIK